MISSSSSPPPFLTCNPILTHSPMGNWIILAMFIRFCDLKTRLGGRCYINTGINWMFIYKLTALLPMFVVQVI